MTTKRASTTTLTTKTSKNHNIGILLNSMKDLHNALAIAPDGSRSMVELKTSEEIELLQLCKSIIEQRCGILNKVDERIIALEREHLGWRHVSEGYGADLLNITSGARIEVKSSTASKKGKGANHQKTNWNFKLNSHPSLGNELTFEEIYVRWARKLLGEDDCKDDGKIRMKEETWNLLKISKTILRADLYPKPSIQIEVEDQVLALLLSCITALNGGTTRCNLGGGRCQDCGKYHRIERYVENVYKQVGDISSCHSFDDFISLLFKSLPYPSPSQTKTKNNPSFMEISAYSPLFIDICKKIITKTSVCCGGEVKVKADVM